MAYVDLSQDALSIRRIFVTMGLADEREEVHAVALAGGVSSGIYRVDLNSGSYCLKQALPKLKVAKDWNVPVERVFAEIDYLRTVDAIAPRHVPRVLGHDDATKSFVMEFLGPEYRNWKGELLAGRIDPVVARTVGDLLGHIHSATADDAELARRFATDDNFHAIRLEPYLVETARVHPALADKLLGMVERTAANRRVLVHGDVSPKNILLGPAGPVLLDAECAWFGDPAFDVAFCLNHFLLKSAHMPMQAGTLMESFNAFKLAYFAQVGWETRSALEWRVASLLPGLALARVDGKSPVEYLSPQAQARVRRVASRLVAGKPTSLDTLATDWKSEFMS